MKLGVFNFASNNYTININNASDFATGDVITVLPHSSYINNDDYHHYQAVKAGQNIDNYYHTSNTHSTVVNVVGNTLYLDRPINYGFVEGKESVVKINRNFKMLGFLSSNGETKFQKPYFKVNQGTNPCQIRIAKNWQFYNVGSSRVSASGFIRGVDFASQDSWNVSIVEGISVIGYNNSDANGLTFQNSHAICRNGYVGNVRDFRPYYSYSRQGTATYNMKMNSLYRFRPESLQNKVTNYNECAGARQWDVAAVYDTDFWACPTAVEFRRNNLHGIYGIPSFIPGSGTLPESTGQIFKNEYNLLYATNLASWNQGVSSQAYTPVGLDIHAEHPGLRLSWQRNESYIGWYNTAGDMGNPLYEQRDLMRADYNLSMVVYRIFIQRTGNDYIRTYTPTDDSYYPMSVFTIYCKTAVPFQIYVEFEYRNPFRLDRAYNTNLGNNGSGLLLSAIQNGVLLSGYPLTNFRPTNAGWNKYSATITGFTSAVGTGSVFLSSRSTFQTIDLRNMRAYVMTNNPNEIITSINTFDTTKYHNLSGDKKYMAPISTGANKFKKVKF
jgi:hypothetical protein